MGRLPTFDNQISSLITGDYAAILYKKPGYVGEQVCVRPNQKVNYLRRAAEAEVAAMWEAAERGAVERREVAGRELAQARAAAAAERAAAERDRATDDRDLETARAGCEAAQNRLAAARRELEAALELERTT